VNIILRKQSEAIELRANIYNDKASRGLLPPQPATYATASGGAATEALVVAASISASVGSSTMTAETHAQAAAPPSAASPCSTAAPIEEDRTEDGGLFL
jgi:hypothetical protein